ncbi:MAG TPA: ArsA-related P-loop ATPase [Dermatophilaceae bacterium]|nr:ArsA-related P-loop ATPase [Dermatophilaceae bacterium]
MPPPSSTVSLPAGSQAPLPDGFERVRLHIVTGKGGTGKTTVAAALAAALAARGKRVLLAEVEGRQGISQTFDVPPLPHTETQVAATSGRGEVVGLSVDAKTALLEYLQLFYKLGRAGGVLERFGAIDFATTIAPGVRDLLLVGRVYEAMRRRADARHHRRSDAPYDFDAVVLDAPPTGRIGRFLSVGAEVADLARMGPIHSQADSITEMLQSEATAVHLVTLLEEMPVQETVDAVAELRSLGMPIGAVVINQARAGLLTDADEGLVTPTDLDPEGVAADLRAVGLDPAPALVDGLVSQVREHAERVELEDEQLTVLEASGLPLVTVPYLVDGVDANAVCEIGELLADQGMVPA